MRIIDSIIDQLLTEQNAKRIRIIDIIDIIDKKTDIRTKKQTDIDTLTHVYLSKYMSIMSIICQSITFLMSIVLVNNVNKSHTHNEGYLSIDNSRNDLNV